MIRITTRQGPRRDYPQITPRALPLCDGTRISAPTDGCPGSATASAPPGGGAARARVHVKLRKSVLIPGAKFRFRVPVNTRRYSDHRLALWFCVALFPQCPSIGPVPQERRRVPLETPSVIGSAVFRTVELKDSVHARRHRVCDLSKDRRNFSEKPSTCPDRGRRTVRAPPERPLRHTRRTTASAS